MNPEQFPALASAISALLAFVFSIYVYVRTNRLLKPTERPIMSLFDNKVQGELAQNPPRLKTNLLFLFKNIGKHPARNLRMRIGVAPKKSPEAFRNVIDVSVANRIDFDGIFNWNQLIEQPVKLEGQVAQLEELELYIYILLIYEDEYAPNKFYRDAFWLTYITGRAGTGHATMQERLAVEPYVKTIYGDQRR